ncbi:MAG: choice-of-anchor D domain-containing protein, partial [Gemmatimonadota bacterium]
VADNQLFGNQVFDWLAGPQWLVVDPASGTVPAGATVDLSVTFDAGGLFGGDYFADLVVASNDPDEPEVVVPAHLHVTGAPDIAVSDTLLSYGEVDIGFTATQILGVMNAGTDDLTVSAITTDHPDYWTDLSAFVLAPSGSQDVVVTFAPSGEGPIAGTLTVLSDDPDQGVLEVALEGEGIQLRVWHVPGDVPSIAAGIDSAAVGEVVLVAPGTYAGEDNRGLNFQGKDIAVISAAGAESTIIDCGELDRAFEFVSNEGAAATVRGFKIVNGRADRGGAIYMHDSSPTIMDCVFADNAAGAVGGGAIYCESGASPEIRGCTFYDNASDSIGGAIRISFASPSISGCTIVRNGAPFGGGVACNGSTFSIANSIIAFSTFGGAIDCAGVGTPSILHCCVFSNAGGDSLCGDYQDNLFVDPLLCDMAARDLTLCENSPCLPAASPWGELIGALGQGCGACGSTPVEVSFYATPNASGTVTLRWTAGDLSFIDGFNIHRATSSVGPFERVNEQLILATSPGEFEDRTVWPGTTFWYKLIAVMPGGTEDTLTESAVSVTTSGQLTAALHPPKPNPFSGETSVAFDVPAGVGRVRVTVYNIRGQLVRELLAGAPGSGRHVARWDGLDLNGRAASSGVYFIMLEAGANVRTRKLLLVK